MSTELAAVLTGFLGAVIGYTMVVIVMRRKF